ncbi:MAG: bifunctional metallophosphatase/5'-nucleotidase [Bacteroidota bacterium]
MFRFVFPPTLAALLVTFTACATVQPVQEVVEEETQMVMNDASDGRVHVTILQVSDLQEIVPAEGGKTGGLARVAGLLRQLEAANPNTFVMVPGDFYSPSAIGTSKVDGVRLNGQQMVAVFNAMGVDYVTFGNHEFDLGREDFYRRLDETEYAIVTSNVTDENGALFPKSAAHELVTVSDEDGTVTLGLLGATIGLNTKDYVRYRPVLDGLLAEVNAIGDQADVLIAITHLSHEQDLNIAELLPEVDLILGGHEHINMELYRGPNFTPLFKVDANTRSVFVHQLYIDPETGDMELDSRLVPVTDALPEDPAVAAVVDEWVEIGFQGFRDAGFDPDAVVTTIEEPLDGREISVRYRPTSLTDLIAEAMLAEAPDAQLAVFNGGSIRIDDLLSPGPITQYDIIRVLPFGGEILTVVMDGEFLARVLDQGVANRGIGGYLQTAGVVRTGEGWLIGDELLDPDDAYRVAINDFLLSGREANLDFLTFDHPGVTLVAEGEDIRMAVIEEMQRRADG